MYYMIFKDGIINFSLSGMCKHVAALLYRVADCVAEGQNRACTSRKQVWHQPALKINKAAFLSDISTPKASPSMTVNEKARRDQFDPRRNNQRRQRCLGDYNLDKLAEISNGKACALLYTAAFREEDPLQKEPDISMICGDHEVRTSSQILTPTVTGAFEEEYDLLINEDGRDWIVANTVEQNESPLWFEHRVGRITSSTIGNVIKHVDSGSNITGSIHSVTGTVMGYYKVDNDRLPMSLKWGRSMEDEALAKYKALQQSHHKHFRVKKTGLWISTDHAYLAASPDSLVECDCCGEGVVETKCPWTHRTLTVHELAALKDSYLTGSEHLTLRQDHPYYAQVQLQMFCTKRKYNDFVVYTKAYKNNICIIRVPFDDQFVTEMISKASVFWHVVIVEELKTGAVRKAIEQKKQCKAMEQE